MLDEYVQFCGQTSRLVSFFVLWSVLSVLLLGAAAPSAFVPCVGLQSAVDTMQHLSKSMADSHLLSLLTLDTVFPIVCFSLFCGVISRCGVFQSFPWLVYPALFITTWDYLENVQLYVVHFMLKAAPSGLLLSALVFGRVKIILVSALLLTTVRLWWCVTARQSAAG